MKPRYSIFFIFQVLILPAILTFAFFDKAYAACHQHIGCTDKHVFSDFDLSLMSCKKLNVLRNSIYAENNYCFRKAQYRQFFIDHDCRYQDLRDVPLNNVERANVLMIVQVEREKKCTK